ncbi:hypothetical protein CK203_025240 [Vitis vinifera]|uniref:DUF4283 domain-containing protein n=1 Tax=Vitis vinifera TaxID=29760 RepID=A0A438JF99_VITVI|nr:hypothetical protein CK203_025240 [Vitis vinifera]
MSTELRVYTRHRFNSNTKNNQVNLEHGQSSTPSSQNSGNLPMDSTPLPLSDLDIPIAIRKGEKKTVECKWVFTVKCISPMVALKDTKQVGFGKEELDWLTEHLKKAVELEDTRGFTRKFKGENKIHLMEICFSNRGRFMKITEIATRGKPLLLVIPKGVKGNGWEVLRRAILSVQDYSDQVGEELKKTFGNTQMSKSIYRGGWSYAEVVAEDGLRSGVSIISWKMGQSRNMYGVYKSHFRLQGVFLCEFSRKSKMVPRAGETFSERKACSPKKMVAKRKYDYSRKIQKGLVRVERPSFSLVGGRPAEIHLEEVGRVTEVAREAVKLFGLDEVAVSVIGEEGEDDIVTSETNHYSRELLPRARYRCSSTSMAAKRVKGWEGSRLGLVEENILGPIEPETSTKAHPVRAQRGRSRGLHAGPDAPQAHDAAASPSSLQSGMKGRSREEESAARKRKALPMVQMEDFTQGEKTLDSRKMWSNLFLPSAARRHGQRSSREPFPLRSALPLSEVHNLEVDGGMGSQQIRGIKESPIFRCLLPRKCKSWSKEETSTSRGEMDSQKSQLEDDKGGFTGPSGPPEPYSSPFCNLEKHLPSPSGPHLPNSEFLFQSPSVNQGGESESCSNQVSERSTPGKSSNLMSGSPRVNAAFPPEDFLIDGLSFRKMAKVREVLCSLDIKVYSKRKNRGP